MPQGSSQYTSDIYQYINGPRNYLPEIHSTCDLAILIQIQALIRILMKWSLQNFAHATTAQLSWHVQKFVAIW